MEMRLPNPPQILMLPTAPQVCQAIRDTSNQAGVHGAMPSFHQDWSMRKHPWHTFWSQWISKLLWKVFRWHFSQPLKTVSVSVGRVTDHNKPGAKLGTFTQTVLMGTKESGRVWVPHGHPSSTLCAHTPRAHSSAGTSSGSPPAWTPVPNACMHLSSLMHFHDRARKMT